jgi:hypothetical protein
VLSSHLDTYKRWVVLELGCKVKVKRKQLLTAVGCLDDAFYEF